MATQWFFQDGGQVQGPVAFRDLVELVRARTLTEVDLVRSSWTSDWQRADSVVGLFHMAGRSEADLARAQPPVPATPIPEPALIEPIDAFSVPDIEQRPTWLKRLFEVGSFRKSRRVPGPTVVDPPAADSMMTPTPAEIAVSGTKTGAAREALIPELAEYALPTNSMSSDWSTTVNAALEHADQRAGRGSYSRRRTGLIGSVYRAARIFAPVARMARSASFRPAFRIVCAFICANLVAFGLEAWSSQEALRFPSQNAISASLRPFPLVGLCERGEFAFLVIDLMVISGTLAYFAAAWLESRAE
jgi:hypothetical protein